MLTTMINLSEVPFTTGSTATDECPSPEEVFRRALEIRATWDVHERIARRRVAEDRFADLVAALGVDGCAA